ncbi:hypothetical protein CCAX7_49830 [Capsulimonas corticalis]|uniref:Uncharacterized protein n=1 Tax=Capsulimonas corticalis TaxID=2219043 RepID=A0A402CPJ3_9BACT|nr:hypothetical protein [Capsulimonas corticalis]BDI32932.1 hypothetical protein CCAX7_49830 [Capsulimonas corticalis]
MIKSVNIFQRRTLAPLTAVLALCGAYPASAASLSFNSTPVSDAVAQIDSKLGITISLKQGIDPNTRVTFSVDDLQGPGARLDAINQLANALNADFQKVIVVRKSSTDTAAPAPVLDSDAPVTFKEGSVAAREAIQTVAEVDGAVAKITENVDGSVKFTGDDMTAKEAAAEIARQSHTVWKTFYAITPRGRGGNSTGGKVIGYTASGKPILELPLRTFRNAPEPPPVDTTADANAATDPNAPNAQPGQNPQGQYPQGGNPYFGYYGPNYNPYNSMGYGGSGGYSNGSGLTVLPGWPGYGFGGGGPIILGTNNPYRY